MKCRGIEIEDGVYSGCYTQEGKLTDCPICHGTGIETGRLISELMAAASGCGLDRDYALAELLDSAAKTIAAFAATVSRLNDRLHGREGSEAE